MRKDWKQNKQTAMEIPMNNSSYPWVAGAAQRVHRVAVD